MNNNVFELTLRKNKRIIPEIASFIADSAIKLGLSEKKAYFLCFTIETALEYRMDALNDENQEIKVRVEDNGSYFKFSVIDFGSPYILSSNQQTILKRKLVDRYSFQQNGRKGQCFSFTYKYEGKPTIIETKPLEELMDDDFHYRVVTDNPDDVLKAVTCLYDTYGYDYYHQHLYSVESFIKYMGNGHYVPIIGENKHGQAACYCALDENTWFLGVPEFSNLVTLPIARGKGLATSIFKETEKIAEERKYEGIHVSAVAYHPYTQKMCNKLGYTPSAIEYSINPKGTGGYDQDRRLDCVIGVKIFNKERKHELYLDKECNRMFSKIFADEKLNFEIHNDFLTTPADNLVTYVIDTDTSNCFFKIDDCNQSIHEELANTLSKEEVKNMEVITVNLNMNNPNCLLGYKTLRELGFICVGCIPGCLNGDYMLLQSFKVTPQYSKIVVEDNYRELVEEVYALNGIKE